MLLFCIGKVLRKSTEEDKGEDKRNRRGGEGEGPAEEEWIDWGRLIRFEVDKTAKGDSVRKGREIGERGNCARSVSLGRSRGFLENLIVLAPGGRATIILGINTWTWSTDRAFPGYLSSHRSLSREEETVPKTLPCGISSKHGDKFLLRTGDQAPSHHNCNGSLKSNGPLFGSR